MRDTTEAVTEIRQSLSDLSDESVLHVNRRHGDDHAVNLTRLRALVKQVGTGRKPAEKHSIGSELWDTGDSACRLAAALLLRPASLSAEELDAMLRDAGTPKVHTWFLTYIVMKSRHTEELRTRWFTDGDPRMASAGWALTTRRLVKNPDEVSEEEPGDLLDIIDSTLPDSPDPLQWSQNECLAQIGINYPEFRERAVETGERHGVLKDYPTPKNCTSPYAPTWIAEMVSRQGG